MSSTVCGRDVLLASGESTHRLVWALMSRVLAQAPHAEVCPFHALFACLRIGATLVQVVIVAQTFAILHVLVKANKFSRHTSFAALGLASALSLGLAATRHLVAWRILLDWL